jgi:cytochrome c oxidase subunit 2
VAAVAASVAVGALVAACGGGGGGSSSTTATTAALSAEAAAGRKLAIQYQCIDCHSADGSKRTGPTWKGLYGSTVKFTDGTTAVADDAYITASIREPNAKIVDGWTGIMPRFQLDDTQIASIIAYIKTLT